MSLQPKYALTSLPPEILLEIASYHLADYLFWENGNFKYLRKYTYEQNRCPYFSLAKAHPYLWCLLMSQAHKAQIRKAPDVTDYANCGVFS